MMTRPDLRLVLWSSMAALLPPAPCAGEVEPQVEWKERIEVASGGGYRGPWRMNRSQFHFVDDPTLAINEQGFVGVAWADQRRQDIFFQLYAPGGEARLEEPVNVSRSPRIFSWLPRMIVTSAAEAGGIAVYVLWQEIVFSGGSHGGEIFFARSTDGGKTFGRPRNLSNTPAGAGKGRLDRRYWHNGSLDLAKGPDGTLYAAWTEYEGPLWVSRSTDSGESFSDPLRIAGGGDSHPARGPALAVDAEGAVYLAWTVGEDPAANIHLTKSTDGGRSFAEPRVVSPSDGHADAPKLAIDGEGSLHVVYAESPAGPLQRYRILATRSMDGGRSFTAPRTISDPPPERSESTGFPALSVGRGNALYVLWELFPRAGGRSRGLGFAVSSDGGQTFSAPAVVPGSIDPALGVNGSQQGLLMRKLAVNAAGAVAVVNSTFRQNESSHVWLFRGQAAAGSAGATD